MKKLLIAFAAGSIAAASCSHRSENVADFNNVVPLPREITASDGGDFRLSGSTVIAYPEGDSALASNARLLAGYLDKLTGFSPDTKGLEDGGTELRDAIVLQASLNDSNPEAYSLSVTADRVLIDGATPRGNFYGIQTLRKSIPSAGEQTVVFPSVDIYDYPRFPYRGAHFDVARHFFPLDSVKAFIDMIALHNINTFHWHLSDDQGWRIEIEKYPLLTEVGSVRKGTCIGRDFESSDSIPYGGFYTKEEARELVRYAAERHITVIPEIDLPGHMLAALTAYPSLGCTGGPYDLWQRWGVSEDLLCAGNDSTYTFIADVLGEIMDVFPSEYVHVGGDECPKVRWEACPKCQAAIKRLGIKADSHASAEEKLQSHVMTFAGKVLAGRGRRMIGWDEMLDGGLPAGAAVMHEHKPKRNPGEYTSDTDIHERLSRHKRTIKQRWHNRDHKRNHCRPEDGLHHKLLPHHKISDTEKDKVYGILRQTDHISLTGEKISDGSDSGHASDHHLLRKQRKVFILPAAVKLSARIACEKYNGIFKGYVLLMEPVL